MHANFDLCIDDGTADALFGKEQSRQVAERDSNFG